MDNFDEFWHNKAMSSVRRWMRHWWAPRTSNPSYSSNFSDSAPKTMQTNADKALECRQNADKMQTKCRQIERKDMEELIKKYTGRFQALWNNHFFQMEGV